MCIGAHKESNSSTSWEPPLLTWVVQVSARIDGLCASIGVRMEKCNSNKGTGGMEISVVLFTPRIHLFACTHPSVSNTLDCNDWLVYNHQSTALCSNTFGLWFLVVHKHQSPPCVSNMSGLWILVCAHASVSSPVQTRLIMVACLFTLPPAPK